MNQSDEFVYEIAVGDFDVSRLPASVRTPGTDPFQEEVRRQIEKDFKGFGGRVQITVTDKMIRVVWRGETSGGDPVSAAVAKLKAGDYKTGVHLLESLQRVAPNDANILYNLGMALSDLRQLDRAEIYLNRLLANHPEHVDGRVALAVVLARNGMHAQAVPVLEEALKRQAENFWAHRNLGACFLTLGKGDEAERHLQRAVALNPTDQQAVFGLAQALELLGKVKEADQAYIRAIDLDEHSDIGEMAQKARSRFAQESFAAKAVGGLRPDAVMYLLGALQLFEKMPRDQIQQIAFEIATLGQRGIDTNDSTSKYTLRSLSGQYSGLHLICLMYASFKVIAPENSIGFDLSKEYEVAMSMHAGGEKGV